MGSSEFEQRYGSRPFVGTTLAPERGPPISRMTWLSAFPDVIEVLRSADFEQAGGGRRDSAPIIGGGMLSLSGADHFERRRLEAPLFRRPHLARLETEVFMPRLVRELEACPRDDDGRLHGDIQGIVRHALLEVSTALVGIDLDGTRAAEIRLIELMDRLGAGVNVEWIDRDHRAVIAEAEVGMAAFEAEFFRPSLEARKELVRKVRAGSLDAAELPNDLITLALLNADHFGRWDEALSLREVILVNGAPSSIPLFLGHALQDLLQWADGNEDRRRSLLDHAFLRSACHESLRIHPATPFLIRRARSEVTLRSGTGIPAGAFVVVDLLSANRDPAIFPQPDEFDPLWRTEGGVKPGALAFGSGPHTCIGMAMTVGDARVTEDGPRGLMVLILRELFARGVTRDPRRPPRLNPTNVRNEYTSFPIRFSSAPAAP